MAKKQNNKKITMEELLARSPVVVQSFEAGQEVKAKILSLEQGVITLDIGAKSDALVIGSHYDEVKGFVKKLKVGDEVNAVVVEPESRDGNVLLSIKDQAFDALWNKLEKAKNKGAEIKVVGKNVTEKGIVVEVEKSLIGFIPASQLGKEAAKEVDKLLDQEFPAKVIEVDRDKNRIVLSERAVSEKEELELEEKALKNLKEGEILKGSVKELTSFGAFVELRVEIGKKPVPIEGLVHISELSWEKISDPSKIVSVGDKVEVKVLGTKDGKLSLSIKDAQKDPWISAEEKYQKEQKLKGKVVRKSGFGVFVELEPGIEGLVHMTKIPPDKDIKKGDEIEVYIEEINAPERKISLGLVLTAKPIGYK